MSGVPISRLSQNARDQLAIWGHATDTLSVESGRRIYERYTDRLNQIALQLVPNMHNTHVQSRVRRKYDALDSALSELHALITPSYVGGVYGGQGREESGATEIGLTRCRYAGCSELADREDRFYRGGACHNCFEAARDPNEPIDPMIGGLK